MSTARFLVLVFTGLLALSAIAMMWRSNRASDGRVPLVWVSDNNPARALQIEAFNEENPGLNLQLDYGNSGAQKIILQSSSGVGPDIFDFQDDDMGTFVESGILWDITEPASRLGFSAAKDCWPASRQNLLYNGRQYGFSCSAGAVILIYNKNVFDYFGVPYPQGLMTWDEFVGLARQVNSATAGKTGDGKRIFAVTGANWRLFFECLRGEIFSEDGQPRIFNSPELRRAFEQHREFLFTHRIMPTTVEARAMSGQGGWGAGGLNQFSTGNYAMTAVGHWSLISFARAHAHQVEQLEQQGLKEGDIRNPLERPLRLGAVLVPTFAGYEPSYRVRGRIAGINARSPHREQALAFLQYLSGPTYSTLLNESADWLPGNPRHANLGVEAGAPALDRLQLQKTTEEAMTHGYALRRSPFLLTSEVFRVLNEQIGRMETDPSIPVENLLKNANDALRVLLRRNLDRNPALKELYLQRFGEASYRALL